MAHFIFDIGGVLIQYNLHILAEQIAVKVGIEPKLVHPLFQNDLLFDIETGKIGGEDFFNQNIKTVLKNWTYQDWIQEFSEHYVKNPPGIKLLQDLKADGEQIYLLSNLAEFHKIAIETKYPDFFSLADINFFSYELGLHKPNPEIYRQVCKNLQAKPAECIFFDDVLANVKGAQQIGMAGVHFSNVTIPEIINIIRKIR